MSVRRVHKKRSAIKEKGAAKGPEALQSIDFDTNLRTPQDIHIYMGNRPYLRFEVRGTHIKYIIRERHDFRRLFFRRFTVPGVAEIYGELYIE